MIPQNWKLSTNDPQPEETPHRWSNWQPTPLPDADWNKKQTRNRPNGGLVAKGQMRSENMGVIQSLLNEPRSISGGNSHSQHRMNRALATIIEWESAGAMYMIHMTSDGVKQGYSWDNTPYRVYSRLPSPDETEWFNNRYYSRKPVAAQWLARFENLSPISSDIDWVALHAEGVDKYEELKKQESNASMLMSNNQLKERTEELKKNTAMLECIKAGPGAADLIDLVQWRACNPMDYGARDADEYHQQKAEEAWDTYTTTLNELKEELGLDSEE